MFSINSLSRHEVRFLLQLVNSAYYTSMYSDTHKSDLSDEERAVIKEHYDFVSGLRFKLIFNVIEEKDV